MPFFSSNLTAQNSSNSAMCIMNWEIWYIATIHTSIHIIILWLCGLDRHDCSLNKKYYYYYYYKWFVRLLNRHLYIADTPNYCCRVRLWETAKQLSVLGYLAPYLRYRFNFTVYLRLRQNRWKASLFSRQALYMKYMYWIYRVGACANTPFHTQTVLTEALVNWAMIAQRYGELGAWSNCAAQSNDYVQSSDKSQLVRSSLGLIKCGWSELDGLKYCV
jgi:hypothetical protein